MEKAKIIELLNLERHPLEDGYFRRTYTSNLTSNIEGKNRRLLSSIYYMLTDDNSIGFLHSNQSDIIHYYHKGAATRFIIMSPDGTISEKCLGPDIANSEQLQLTIPGGYWKASVLCSGEYSLISEAVSPGFDYSDNQLATYEFIANHWPENIEILNDYIK